MAQEIFGIDRNRTYTREEICRRFGYDPEGMPSKTAQDKELQRSEKNNRDRFFREHFLKRRLPALPVGKTYEVAGDLYYAWTMANSRLCAADDPQVQTGETRPR